MIKNVAWNEAESFDALWDQYGDSVYNLAIRLAGSAKEGWLLARSALLVARQNLSAMEGHTPTQWLYQITIQTWYAPYEHQRSLWNRWFKEKKFSWELSLPDSVESSLTYLSDRHEAITLLLKTLDYPQRLMAILRLADGYSVGDVCQMAPFRDDQINKLTRKATERLAKALIHSGNAVSGSPADRAAKVSSFLREWKPLKAPMSLKADVIQKRVYQKRMQQDHIPDQYSLKGIIWVWVVVLSLLVGSLGYFFVTGRQMRDVMDERLLRQTPGESSARKVGH